MPVPDQSPSHDYPSKRDCIAKLQSKMPLDPKPRDRGLFLPSLPPSGTRAHSVTSPACQFGRLNRHSLLLPRDRASRPPDRPDLIATEPWYADVVLALQDELEVADLEGGAAAEFGELAGGAD
jgi:hypothetical protein